MVVPSNKLPGWLNENGVFCLHERVAKLIRDNNGIIMPFRSLSIPAQLALIQYMSIDGEAWDTSAAMDNDIYEYQLQFRNHYDSPKANKAWADILRKHRLSFIEEHGGEEFGYVTIPTASLIESVMQDADFAAESFEQHHQWYMHHCLKHSAVDPEAWPVILSSFGDETLQDGWSRFNSYVERRLALCPAIFYPRTSGARDPNSSYL
jgi:hypothetical protein